MEANGDPNKEERMNKKKKINEVLFSFSSFSDSAEYLYKDIIYKDPMLNFLEVSANTDSLCQGDVKAVKETPNTLLLWIISE